MSESRIEKEHEEWFSKWATKPNSGGGVIPYSMFPLMLKLLADFERDHATPSPVEGNDAQIECKHEWRGVSGNSYQCEKCLQLATVKLPAGWEYRDGGYCLDGHLVIPIPQPPLTAEDVRRGQEIAKELKLSPAVAASSPSDELREKVDEEVRKARLEEAEWWNKHTVATDIKNSDLDARIAELRGKV